LLAEIGDVCAAFHDRTVRNLQVNRVECDEIWSFCYAKARNVPEELKGKDGVGDVWTWVGLDAETKLAISWAVGDRGPDTGLPFMKDLASRIATRIQLTTDGHGVYLTAVEQAFGWAGVDYTQLVKHYSAVGTGRYSPAVCTGTSQHWVMGRPREENVSTSYVERANLTMRMQMRRFTRLTNAFSKKLENHAHAVSLHFVHYNFCRVHHTLTERKKGIHQTPAMAAGLTNRVWTVDDLVSLLTEREKKAAS
jgi:IS1 family transposase